MTTHPKTTKTKQTNTAFSLSTVDSEGAAGNLRRGQAEFIRRIQAAGSVGFVARDCGEPLRGLEGLHV